MGIRDRTHNSNTRACGTGEREVVHPRTMKPRSRQHTNRDRCGQSAWIQPGGLGRHEVFRSPVGSCIVGNERTNSNRGISVFASAQRLNYWERPAR